MQPFFLLDEDKSRTCTQRKNQCNQTRKKSDQAVGHDEADNGSTDGTCCPIDVAALDSHELKRLLQPLEQRVFCIPAVGVRVCAHCRLARYTKEQRQCLCGRHKEDTSSHNHHDRFLDILFLVVHLDIHTDSTYNRHHTGNSVTQFDHIRHILGNFRRHSPKGCSTSGIVTCRILSDCSCRSDKQHERHHFDSLGRANALHHFFDFLKHFLTLIISTQFDSSAQSSVFISDIRRRQEIGWRH